MWNLCMPGCTCMCVCSVVSDSVQPSVHGILQAGTLEWACHFFLQGIFLTQEYNPRVLHLLYWWADSLLLRQLGSYPNNLLTATQFYPDILRKKHIKMMTQPFPCFRMLNIVGIKSPAVAWNAISMNFYDLFWKTFWQKNTTSNCLFHHRRENHFN